VERDGVRVAFVHAMLQSPTDRRRAPLFKEGYNVDDAAEALGRILPKVKKKADFVVLLAHAPWGRLNELLKQIPDVDLVLAAHDAGLDRKIREVQGKKLMRSGRRGQYVIKVSAVVDPDGRVKSLEGEAIPIKTSLPQDSVVAAMVKEATDRYNKMRRERLAAKNRREEKKLKGDKFLGAKICSRCHQEIYEAWSNTPHASAFQTLVKEGAQNDSDCIGCHTTGHGKPTGYMPPASGEAQREEYVEASGGPPDLRNVQCEACHGMGTHHRRNGGEFRKVTEKECVACHNEEHSPSFDYEEYLPSVSCSVMLNGTR